MRMGLSGWRRSRTRRAGPRGGSPGGGGAGAGPRLGAGVPVRCPPRRTRELVPRLFLAGGLTPENVGAAVRAVRPYAVGVWSGVEMEPGRKAPRRLRAFI